MALLDQKTVTVAEIVGITAPPSAPALLYPVNGDTNISASPTLGWSPVAVATSYHLQLATDTDFNELVVDQGSISESVLGVSGLTLGEEYFWRVLASNSYGDSPWSETWSFTVSAAAEEDPMASLLAMAMMVMVVGMIAPMTQEGG